MKKFGTSGLIALAFLFSGTTGINADYLEVKTADGTYGISSRNTYYPYVCYQRRLRLIKDGYQYLRYDGCVRSTGPCENNGLAHFGRYPNNRASYRALQRCLNATPRFVD